MHWKSTKNNYGLIAVVFHWLSAVLLLLLFISGFSMASTVDPQVKLNILRLHGFFGVCVLLLTILRILWRLLEHKPAAPAATKRWQLAVAHLVQGLMYVFMLILGASGLGMLLVSGAKDIVLGQVQATLPNFNLIRPHVPHVMMARLLIAASVIHILAALYHQFILRDEILARMGFGKAQQ